MLMKKNLNMFSYINKHNKINKYIKKVKSIYFNKKAIN